MAGSPRYSVWARPHLNSSARMKSKQILAAQLRRQLPGNPRTSAGGRNCAVKKMERKTSYPPSRRGRSFRTSRLFFTSAREEKIVTKKTAERFYVRSAVLRLSKVRKSRAALAARQDGTGRPVPLGHGGIGAAAA